MVWTCREKLVDSIVTRVDQTEDSHITRGIGRP